MSVPSGQQLSRDFRSLAQEQRARQRVRIVGDNIEATDVIRPLKILAAKEAIERGQYDAPAVLDNTVDLMLAHSDMGLQYQEREAERDLMDSIVGHDIERGAKSAFWTDYED